MFPFVDTLVYIIIYYYFDLNNVNFLWICFSYLNVYICSYCNFESLVYNIIACLKQILEMSSF